MPIRVAWTGEDGEDWGYDVDGPFFHVSPTANRASIARHGLDWTRMAVDQTGIAGSRQPELDGVYLGQHLHDAAWFTWMARNREVFEVDVWEVDLDEGFRLVHDGGGYLYSLDVVPPDRLRLVPPEEHAPPPFSEDTAQQEVSASCNTLVVLETYDTMGWTTAELGTAGVGDRLEAVRERTLALVADLPDEVMHRPLDPIMSPLVWDLAHIAAYEDLWAVHRLTGEPLLHEDLAATYDAFETPREVRGDIELLDRPAAEDYLERVRDRTLGVLDRTGPSELHELVARHELQHTETMRQAMFLGGLPGGFPSDLPRFPGEPEFVAVEGAIAEHGAGDGGFAYDNERPRHSVALEGFRIARTPVTNATWLAFTEGGGYQRREWWSDEGWSWKQCYDIGYPLGWRDDSHPDEPVLHVSWFEADAFARSLRARLPTEAEWERAATSDQLDGRGLAWEWTATEFGGYPGFRAHPYREYSEVFFDRGYRVLRGGSWAAASEVATPTFRNWDRPERRQIFSGVRLVREM